MRVRVVFRELKLKTFNFSFFQLDHNTRLPQQQGICHTGAGYRSYYRQFTGFSLNFLSVSPAFDSAPFPPARNAPFSRKFSFRTVISFEMCPFTSSPRTPSRRRPHLLISFQNDRPCKSRLELCSRIISNPVMTATSAELPFPTPPKFRFNDPIFTKKPQFTFPFDV